MKKQTLLFLLTALLSFTGCDKCSNVDCMPDIFVFKLTDKEGRNLIDNGLIKLDQVTLLAKSSSSFSAELYTLSRGNETWVEAVIHRNFTDFQLQVTGYSPQELKLNYTENKGDCCTTVTVQEAYQNGTLTNTSDKGSNIILP